MTTRLENLHNKIVNPKQAIQRMRIWRNAGLKVTFTNGCFDILHQGHVLYLTQAADLGNRLVVGLNSDASVRRQGKIYNRPINNQEARAIMLAGLSVVDIVVLFDDNTPYRLIQTLEPDILAKADDYDAQERNQQAKKYIVGADIMDNIGGKVITIPSVQGVSTTNIIEKIKFNS